MQSALCTRPSNTQTLPSLTAIRLFAAAYEERSFSRAAAREHTTQPAVSQRVRALEDELGVRLLERSPRCPARCGSG